MAEVVEPKTTSADHMVFDAEALLSVCLTGASGCRFFLHSLHKLINADVSHELNSVLTSASGKARRYHEGELN